MWQAQLCSIYSGTFDNESFISYIPVGSETWIEAIEVGSWS